MIEQILSEAPCFVCGKESALGGAEYVDSIWNQSQLFKQLSINWCNSCGFGFPAPDLSEEIVNNFYTSDYRNKNTPFFIDFDSLEQPFSWDNRSLAQILLAKQFVSFNQGDYFVDVGPGAGTSFSVARNILKRPKMIAVEMSEGAMEAYRRLYSAETVTSIADLIARGIKAKIALFSHSLEHFSRSQLSKVLNALRELVALNGAVVVEVPHVDMRKHILCKGGFAALSFFL